MAEAPSQQCNPPSPTLQGFQQILEKMGIDMVLPEINNIKSVLTSIQEKQSQLEQSLNYTQGEHDETKRKVVNLESENALFKSRLVFMESRLLELEKNQNHLQEQQNDSQYRSMKNNLTFHNIPEHTGENVREVLINFITKELKIVSERLGMGDKEQLTSEDRIVIARCHRYGNPGKGGAPQPVVAVLIQGKDCILREAKHLANTSYFIASQLPPAISEQKRKVLPIFNAAKKQGNMPKFVGKGNAVVVQGRKFEAPKLPQCSISVTDIINNTPLMGIVSTEGVVEKGNKFVSHIASVTTPTEIAMAISSIKHTGNRGLSTVTHNMYAARVFKEGRIVDFYDDDSEFGGAKHILEEMQLSNITNRVIVVSRWFSGYELDPMRFEIIKQCTRAAIQSSLNMRSITGNAQKTPSASDNSSMATASNTSGSKPVSPIPYFPAGTPRPRDPTKAIYTSTPAHP